MDLPAALPPRAESWGTSWANGEPLSACAGARPRPGQGGDAPRGWVTPATPVWPAVRATQSAPRRHPGGPTINTQRPAASAGLALPHSAKEAQSGSALPKSLNLQRCEVGSPSRLPGTPPSESPTGAVSVSPYPVCAPPKPLGISAGGQRQLAQLERCRAHRVGEWTWGGTRGREHGWVSSPRDPPAC